MYAKAKLQAERLAWEIASRPGAPEAVVIPGAVIGPPLISRKASTADIIRRMLAGQMPAIPRLGLAYSDMHDLAVAHRLAMELPAAAGNRYVCASENVWMSELAGILKARYGPRDYRVSTRDLTVAPDRSGAISSSIFPATPFAVSARLICCLSASNFLPDGSSTVAASSSAFSASN